MGVAAGRGSHRVSFYHPLVDQLDIYTGLNSVTWGYGLNTANFPTYGGEVVQILSCYVDDLTVGGELQRYTDMEVIYSYFLNYIRGASGDGVRDERPMTFRYDHRGWEFKIIPTAAPGFRKSRDLTVPEWQISAFVIDDAGDVNTLKDLIVSEAEIKAATNSDENFGLEGRIGFTADNPFSDPFTSSGLQFATSDKEALKHLSDYYSSLLPSYMNGDFDAIFGSIGSEPAFNPTLGQAKGVQDNTSANHTAVVKAKRGK